MLERQHGGDRRIVFAGFQADPAVTIAVADLFALPSTYPAESLPTVIIEALSVGVPVVATNVGEVGAMLTGPGGAVAGCVLPLRHGEVDVEELRAAIQGFVDDRAALARAAEATAGAFRPYDLTSCAEAYVDLYSDVLSSSGTRARTSASH
jgi:glycosyltransferase involved in cell wall biosynthesis